MQNNRRWIWGASLLLFFCVCAGVSASSAIVKVDAYVRNDFTFKFNGKTVQVKQPPIMYNDYSYMSLRDISEMLDMDIRFDPVSRTVYINGEIRRVSDSTDYDITGGEFKLSSPIGYNIKYLGREYPVLGSRDFASNVEYLRLSDLERMGVNAKGLTVTRETLTKELYVRRDEADKLWLEKPQYHYNTGTLVTGERDADKVEALKKFPQEISRVMNPIDGIPSFASYVLVYTIDATPVANEYKALCYNNGKWLTIELTLRQDTSVTNKGKWFISGYNTTDLEAAATKQN